MQNMEDHNWQSEVDMVQVTFDVPFPIPTPNGSIYIKTDTDQVKVNVEIKRKEMKHADGESISSTKVGFSLGGRFDYDRFGQYHYSSMQFRFKVNPHMKKELITEELFLGKSIEAANRIFDTCRMVSDLYCPRHIVRLDVSAYSVYYFNINGKNVRRIEGGSYPMVSKVGR